MKMIGNIFCMLVGAFCSSCWWSAALWGREVHGLWVISIFSSISILFYLIYSIRELAIGYEKSKLAREQQ